MLKADFDSIKLNHQILENNLLEERKLRRKYYNDLEDLKGKIRVFCRIRPLAKYEIEKNCEKVVSMKNDTTVKIKHKFGEKEFDFNRIFTAENSQKEVFEDTDRLIQSAVDGFNVCIFAYGQTGSGKSWSIVGYGVNRGIYCSI